MACFWGRGAFHSTSPPCYAQVLFSHPIPTLQGWYPFYILPLFTLTRFQHCYFSHYFTLFGFSLLIEVLKSFYFS